MAQEAARISPSKTLANVSEDYWDVTMRLNPLNATYYGYPRYHDRLDDNSAAGRAEEKKELQAILSRLKTIDRSMVSESDAISWDVLELLVNQRLEEIQLKLWQWDINFFLGPEVMIPWTIEMAQPMKTEEDAQAVIKRLEAMPRYFANQAQNLKEGLSEGRITVRSPLQRTIQQLEDMVKIPPERTAYAVAANRLPEPIRKEYLPKVLHAVETSVYPAFKQYGQFLKSRYLPNARPDETPGIWKLPQG
ncbi:MAG: DUF885 family protein, partial [Elusimicrobia bacterium]|nr:DUF885 family protein [Elusimicrobiota bacterium]